MKSVTNSTAIANNNRVAPLASGVTLKNSYNQDVDNVPYSATHSSPSPLSSHSPLKLSDLVSTVVSESKEEAASLNSQPRTTSSSLSSLGVSEMSAPFAWRSCGANMNVEIMIGNISGDVHYNNTNSLERGTKNANDSEEDIKLCASKTRKQLEVTSSRNYSCHHKCKGIEWDAMVARLPETYAHKRNHHRQKQQNEPIESSSPSPLAQSSISSLHRRRIESNNSSTLAVEDKSSGSSDDGGYEGSASSNDGGGGSASGSCSSPSYASSEENRAVEDHDHRDHRSSNKESHNRRINCGARFEEKTIHYHRSYRCSKRRVKRLKRSSSFSSELADFSSGAGSGSGSPVIVVSDGNGSFESENNNSFSGIIPGPSATISSQLSFSTTSSSKVAAVAATLYSVQERNCRDKPQPPSLRESNGRDRCWSSSSSRLRHQSVGTKTTGLSSSDELKGYCEEKECFRRKQHAKVMKNSPPWSFDSGGRFCLHDLQQPQRKHPSTSSITTTDNMVFTNDNPPPPHDLIQQKQHNELKATFQSALDQLRHTTAIRSGGGCCNKAFSATAPLKSNTAETVTNFVEDKAAVTAVITTSNTLPIINLTQDIENNSKGPTVPSAKIKFSDTHKTIVYDMNADVMACIMSYIEPIDVNSILSMPLSKMWRSRFTDPQDIWKILCLSRPFHAKFEAGGSGDDDDWLDSFQRSRLTCSTSEARKVLGKYRLLYTSFIKCLRYLEKIKDDALNGRTPVGIDQDIRTDGETEKIISSHPFNRNSNLKHFFAKAREVRQRNDSEELNDSIHLAKNDDKNGSSYLGVESVSSKKQAKSKAGVKYAHSSLTRKLLGPAHEAGIAGDVNLPWSCAIYSVVNWMVVFTDVAGIQNMCLKVLPYLLEDEKQRTSAQHAGLTDIVLRAMVLFPSIAELHTAAFHTLVLLARPLGGKEGMLFHSAMVNASGIFNVGSNTGKSGIAVMLDSMKRFSSDEDLQAMGCWSMVNIALIPSQKVVLVKLGGISVAANAMMEHPHNTEVQFRSLFALINLVIPSENLPENSAEAAAIREQVGDVNETSEREMLDEAIGQITNLVVVSMKNFCRNDAILNRACLVLHNLSLNENYHRVLLWTPNCYQMLEWCIGNYRHDAVLQQSAGGTLQRLQMTLASDGELRQRFAECIRAQQQYVSGN